MKCRICGSDRLSLYYTQGNSEEYKFYICSDCTAVNYDLSGGLNQEKYTSSYLDPNDESNKININQRETYNHIIKHFPKPGKMLEIGCGNGKILLLMQSNNWQVSGIELSEDYAKEITKRFKIKVDVLNFIDDNISDINDLDLVVMRHVLEHLPDPILALKRIHSMLKPGAHALMEFPNIEALDFKVKRFLNKIGVHKKKYRTNFKPGHCNEYNKQSFNKLAEICGFELVSWATYSGKPIMNMIYSFVPIGSKARIIIKKI